MKTTPGGNLDPAKTRSRGYERTEASRPLSQAGVKTKNGSANPKRVGKK